MFLIMGLDNHSFASDVHDDGMFFLILLMCMMIGWDVHEDAADVNDDGMG